MTMIPPIQPVDGPRDHEELIDLYKKIGDMLEGLETMRDKGEPATAEVASELIDMHEDHRQQLADAFTEVGLTVDDDTTLLGSLNEAIVEIRAIFEEIDADILPRVAEGERALIESYSEALSVEDLPNDVIAVLNRQRDAVTAAAERLDS